MPNRFSASLSSEVLRSRGGPLCGAGIGTPPASTSARSGAPGGAGGDVLQPAIDTTATRNATAPLFCGLRRLADIRTAPSTARMGCLVDADTNTGIRTALPPGRVGSARWVTPRTVTRRNATDFRALRSTSARRPHPMTTACSRAIAVVTLLVAASVTTVVGGATRSSRASGPRRGGELPARSARAAPGRRHALP